MVVSLEFTTLSIGVHGHLAITDGDGTTLLERDLNFNSNKLPLPANIRSRSNVIIISFRASSGGGAAGWNFSWSAVTPGECHLSVFYGPEPQKGAKIEDFSNWHFEQENHCWSLRLVFYC